MGQYWRLVNFDRRAVRGVGKLGCGIWGVNLHNLLLPGVMDPLLPLDQIQRNLHLPQFHDQEQSRLLTVLPRDILFHIFDTLGRCVDDIDSRVAVACFSLACQLCFGIGYRVLKTLQKATHSWAGERLVIAGHSQSPDDLPPGLEDDPYCQEYECSIYDAAERFDNPLSLEVTGFLLQSGASRSDRTLAIKVWLRMFGERTPPSMAYPILRNLSTREYARQDVLEGYQEDGEHDEAFCRLAIGDLAAFRICWSSDGSVSMQDACGIYRGPWAGDRFDVVDLESVDVRGWTDVSTDLIDEVAGIYRAEFGSY